MEKPPHEFGWVAQEMIAELRGLRHEIPKKQHKRATLPLAKLVEDLLTKHQIGRASPEQAIRDQWPEMVGAANAHYSHAVSIDPRGNLIVFASHGVVRQELSMHRRTIVQRIKALPGCAHVKDLTIRAG